VTGGSGSSPDVRARFAPNPSGDLHVGSAHTALFNWLFARHTGGTFVLRIEDTDPETAKPELVDPIMESLRWLGIDWDEGPDVGGPYAPYRDSERRAFHDEVLARLIADDNAYRCWCTRDDLKARRVEAGYDRYCRHLSDAERSELEASGKPAAVRFAVPEGRTEVVLNDLIMGEVRSEDLQDRVIARSDGSPLYILAVTADDIAMDITHAIRGADLLPSTPMQVLVTEALGAKPPQFGHLPVILGPDRAKLSKRHGATGILTFRDEGILPEALVNFLALLGWSSPSQEEMLPLDRIVEEFTLDRVHAANPIFDHTKLEWMNEQYVQHLEPAEFERRVIERDPRVPREVLSKTIELGLVQTRVKRLTDVPGAIRYLHERPAIDESAGKKWLGTDEARTTLETVAERLDALEPWEPEAIKTCVQSTIEELGLHRRKGPKPIFVAIAGSEVALPLFESIWLIGRDEAVARLRAAPTSG
jgi:glutamyl-tRNA synthetase